MPSKIDWDAPLCFPPARMHFCELVARLSFANEEDGSTVPRKMLLYWFILYAFCVSLTSSRPFLDMPVRSSPSIGEEQGRVIVRDRARRRDESVLVVLAKVVEERLANFGRRPVAKLGGGRRGGSHPVELV